MIFEQFSTFKWLDHIEVVNFLKLALPKYAKTLGSSCSTYT